MDSHYSKNEIDDKFIALTKAINQQQADVKEIKDLIKNIKVGFVWANVSFSFISRVVAIFAGIGAVILAIKYGIANIIHWALRP